MNLFNFILNIIFPSYCMVCKKSGYDICKECLSKSSTTERETDLWIFPIFDYRDPVIKKSIGYLKYKNKKYIAEFFAEIIYEKIIEELADLEIFENFKNPILIPIPLSKEKQKERGYNQTELLCENIIKFAQKDNDSNITYLKNIIHKTKNTLPQARIKNRRERLENLKNAFSIKNKEEIKNRNIIIIDDVTTTGATLKEIKKLLEQNGAKNIIAFTVAH
jgi:competence protein ComFC